MLVAMIRAVVNKVTGKMRFFIEWRHLPPEKGYFMMALHRPWTDRDISILFKYQDNLKKAAKILGRSYGSVRVKLSEIRKKHRLKRRSQVKFLTFPEPDISLRMEVMRRLLPRALKIYEASLDKLKKSLDNVPELTFKEHAYLSRVIVRLFDTLEKWQTGKEHLEIYKDEKEHADQPDEDEKKDAEQPDEQHDEDEKEDADQPDPC